MSEPADGPRRRADGPLVYATWLCLVAVVPPYLRVVDSAFWTLQIGALAALVLGASYLARRRGLPAVAVSLAGLAVWTAFVTFAFFRDTAIVWVIPSPDTIDAVRVALGTAADEIQNSAAPVAAGAAISFLLVASMGLLAVVVDHLVVGVRMPLLAAVGLIAVSLVPPFVVPGDVDVVSFVFLAGSLLVMVRAETLGRSRMQEPAPRGPRTMSGAPLLIGAVGVVVALVVTPLLPRPVANPALTPGTATISTDLSLGDDLRRPREIQVLLERTSAAGAPYLRVSTLTTFDGTVWRADRLEGAPLEQQDAFVGDGAQADIAVEEVSTSVRVTGLASPLLPVPYPAVAVDGLDGEWLGAPGNGTVASEETDSSDQTYTVTTAVPEPTLDQIRALDADGPGLPPEAAALPPDLPSVIGELAASVTATATTDYDRLVALQDWFRGPEFAYSLEAPVDEGFDGSGIQALGEFLIRREGYCVHFASAFALMARSLDMPSRVVVGYLPGTPTTDTVDGQTVYSVTSGQLHAWPEVYFDGLGWVAWEPTKSLGVATAFSGASSGSDAADDEPEATATPTPTARPDTETAAPDEQAATTDAPGDGFGRGASGGWVVVGILVLLLLPAVVRGVLARRGLGAARRGDVVSAWAETGAIAADLGLDVAPSASPRRVGAELVAAGAPEGEVGLLVTSIERRSYALDGGRDGARGDELADAVLAVRAGLRRTAGRRRALVSVLAPRSLLALRPGAAARAPLAGP